MMPTVVFPVGRETLAWIRDGGTPSRASWSGRLMLGWQNYWFDRTLGLQRRLPSAPALSSDPVFILGLWRTGTTHLHELFSACPGLLCPATWQCMNPASLRLNAAPRQSRMMQRPMDHLSISALSPQEDEFALLALGVPSIYRGFLDPRRLPELSQWLDPAVWASGEPPGWTTAWQEFLSGVVAGRSGRLTLKSPSHTFRVRALTEFFPKASYVWLIRDPVATFLSNRKMWLAMFERYALWPWDFSTLDDFLCQAFIFAAQCLSEATALLPREHLVVVSFEQLTHTTLATVEGINRRLSLGRWDQIYAAIEQMVAAKADYRPATYDRTQLPAGALKAAEKLLAAQTSALATHGLTPPA